MRVKLLLLVLLVSLFTACSGRYYDSRYDYNYPRQNVTNKYYINPTPTPKPTFKYFTKKKKSTPKPKSTPKKYNKKTSTTKKVYIKKRR